ncbi:MAG: SDR family NAD(P)-dependent oxidoreductase, partial [Desulfovibrio sp.]|nr:SDR family NAD(P)-dependent oxidoreductase [Desulfovibrio sp.]
VCAVGSKVKGLEVGARVICFGSHCFASEVVTKEEACVRVPMDWDAVSAATVPVTFFTAYYALSYLARLKKGDKVLRHGACGGGGLAAIQVAQGLGLELYVTAGSPLKRRFLQLLGLKHIYDSRSLSFRDEILADTGGSGLDCVLNSLAGEAIEAGLAVLKPFGRFLELGKSDYYSDAPKRLRPFRNNIAYFGIDVDQLMQERPKLGQELFAEMMQGFLKGLYHPLPCTVFEAQEVESAFRYMQKSRQIGKVVITPPLAAKPRQNTSARLESSAVQVSYEGSYLITGGLAGFGLATARFLQELGAGALILVSRKGENAANQKDIAALRENNPACQIRTLACDVTDAVKLAGLLEQELRTLPPLKGVIHAAAVLDDALLSKMTKEKLGRVLSPKFAGALALHQLSLKYQLDFFVVYSSISALVGNPGQTNYVAANVAMEGLILARRAQGLPALALGWGAIKDTGMLTRDAETMKSLTAMTGLVPLDSRQALQALAKLPSNCPPLTYIFGADFRKLAALPLMRDQRCQPLVGEEFGPKEQGESLLTRLANLNEEECHDLILSEVTALIARILRTSVNNVRPATPLQEMGIDSLMGVELSLALEELLGGHPLQGAISANISAEGITSRILQSLNRNEESGEQLFLTEMAESHGLTLSGQLEAVAKEAMREK